MDLGWISPQNAIQIFQQIRRILIWLFENIGNIQEILEDLSSKDAKCTTDFFYLFQCFEGISFQCSPLLDCTTKMHIISFNTFKT